MKNDKLTSAQESVLKQAAKTGTLISSELTMKGGARKKVLESLTSRGFLIALKEPDTYDISPRAKKPLALKMIIHPKKKAKSEPVPNCIP